MSTFQINTPRNPHILTTGLSTKHTMATIGAAPLWRACALVRRPHGRAEALVQARAWGAGAHCCWRRALLVGRAWRRQTVSTYGDELSEWSRLFFACDRKLCQAQTGKTAAGWTTWITHSLSPSLATGTKRSLKKKTPLANNWLADQLRPSRGGGPQRGENQKRIV